MTTKAKKKTRKLRGMSTDWRVGQPLAFPPKRNPTVINRLAREAIREAMRGAFQTTKAEEKIAKHLRPAAVIFTSVGASSHPTISATPEYCRLSSPTL
jgi:hypothetical protein